MTLIAEIECSLCEVTWRQLKVIRWHKTRNLIVFESFILIEFRMIQIGSYLEYGTSPN